MSICPLCHKAKHIGLADKQGYGEKVRSHMAKHNAWNSNQVETYIQEARRIVKSKGGKHYELDLTYLNRSEFSFLRTKFTNDESDNCNISIKY